MLPKIRAVKGCLLLLLLLKVVLEFLPEKLDKLTANLKDKYDKAKVLETYINYLKASKNNLNGFDEGLFYALVDRIKVNKDGIVIVWKDGTES